MSGREANVALQLAQVTFAETSFSTKLRPVPAKSPRGRCSRQIWPSRGLHLGERINDCAITFEAKRAGAAIIDFEQNRAIDIRRGIQTASEVSYRPDKGDRIFNSI